MTEQTWFLFRGIKKNNKKINPKHLSTNLNVVFNLYICVFGCWFPNVLMFLTCTSGEKLCKWPVRVVLSIFEQWLLQKCFTCSYSSARYPQDNTPVFQLRNILATFNTRVSLFHASIFIKSNGPWIHDNKQCLQPAHHKPMVKLINAGIIALTNPRWHSIKPRPKNTRVVFATKWKSIKRLWNVKTA